MPHHRIPTHVPNAPAIQRQPNEKVKPDQVDIPITLQERPHPALDQAVIAIAQHHPDDYRMELHTDIIHIMFE